MLKSINTKILRFKGESCAQREEGAIAIVFACVMIALVIFIGLALDVSMLLLDRNKMDNLCQVITEDRFVHEETIRFADDPAQETANYVNDILHSNSFVGHYAVEFKETKRTDNLRHTVVKVTLSKQSPLYFLKIFGVDSLTVTSSTTFEDEYGEGGNDVVWAPSGNKDAHDGTIEGDVA